MNKCCQNCEYLNKCRITRDNFMDEWFTSKDFCSRWKEKQESEVEKLISLFYYDIQKTHRTEDSYIAKYILKNYIEKEKLNKYIDIIIGDSPYSPSVVIHVLSKVKDFINSQTGEE